MSQLRPTPPLIDCHAHIFHQGMPFVSSAWNTPKYDQTVEQYLGMLDAHGIHFGVISAISLFGTYNDYMMESLAKHKRLRGTANVTSEMSARELRDLRDGGVVGIRFFREPNTFGEASDIFSDDARRLLARARDLDWHVHFIASPEMFDETLDGLTASGAKVVVDHFALCDTKLGLDCPKLASSLKAVEKGNTWLKISGGFRFTSKHSEGNANYVEAAEVEHELVQKIIARVGTDRLLWGSDTPFIPREEGVTFSMVVSSFINAVPDEAQRKAISDTGLKFYFY